MSLVSMALNFDNEKIVTTIIGNENLKYNPKVIFADEPTGNLDSGTGDKITDLLFDLAKKQGVTLIIVTHDEDLAKLCNRIIRISDGQIISDQTVRSDYQAKASEKREKEAARVRKANK